MFNPYFNINTLSLNQKGYYYENEKNIQEILHRWASHFQGFRSWYVLCGNQQVRWKPWETKKCVMCVLLVMIPSVYSVEYCERNPRTQRKAGEVNGTLNRWFSCGFCCALVSILYQLRSRIFSAFLSKMAVCLKRPPFWIRIAGRAWERDCMFDAKIWNLCIHEWRLVHTCICLLRSAAY